MPEFESLLHVLAAKALMKGDCVGARIFLDGISV
jgi:hypothetical protein